MDLAEFVAARLDEDEAICLATGGAHEREWDAAPPDGMHEGRVEDGHGDVVVYNEGVPSFQQSQHIARHDPARVLREVDAKRKIVALHSPWEDSGDCSACGDVPQVRYPCETLRSLAAAWSDHPDYDPAWR